jgi:magnesium-transporting ATPase (P-type)
MLLRHYYPIFLKSLSPIFQILYFIFLLTIVGIASGIVMAIESGFSGKLKNKKENEKRKRKLPFVIVELVILFPIKIFIFTFVIYLAYSYYSNLYIRIFNDPGIIKSMHIKSYPIVFAPIFAILITLTCCGYWLVAKQLNRKNT